MRLGNDTLGLLIFVVALVVGALQSDFSNKGSTPPAEPEKSLRRPPVHASPAPPPAVGKPLPDEGSGPTIDIKLGAKDNSTGTAFAIAGKDEARPDSMIAAIQLAAEAVEKRREMDG